MKSLNVFCAVIVAVVAISDARKAGLSESFEIIGGLAKAANRIVAKTGETYINQVPGRALQTIPFADVTAACSALLFPNAANNDLSTTPASIEAFLKCVKSAVTTVFDNCLSNFPGVGTSFDCLIDLEFSDDLITQLSATSGSEYDSGTDSDLDSTQEIVVVFADPFPASNCSLFGTAADPQPASCLSLLDASGIAAFATALSNNFAGQHADCAPFLQLLQESNLTSVAGEGDSDQATVQADITQFQENFDSCDGTDEIRDSLGSKYNNGAASMSLWAVFAVPSLLLCLLSA